MAREGWKVVLFVSLFCFGIFKSEAQGDQNKQEQIPLKDKLFVGGGLGLGFGDVTWINVTPQVGLRLNENLSVGIGGIYQYVRDKRFSPAITQDMYGGNLFARHIVIENIFVATDFQIINLEDYSLLGRQIGPAGEIRFKRRNIPVWFVGGGVRLPIGANSNFIVSALYDVIQDRSSPYRPGNFLLSMGVAIGL